MQVVIFDRKHLIDIFHIKKSLKFVVTKQAEAIKQKNKNKYSCKQKFFVLK